MSDNRGEVYLQNTLSKTCVIPTPDRNTSSPSIFQQHFSFVDWFHISTLAGKLKAFLVSSLFVAEKLAGASKPVFIL